MSEQIEQELTRIMAERGLDRKGAMQYYRRQQKKQPAAPTAEVAVDIETTGGPVYAGLDLASSADLAHGPGEGLTPNSAPVQAATETQPDAAEVPAQAEQPTEAAAPADAAPKGKRQSKRAGFDTNRAVALYQGGMKVIDIAVEMGYPRGQGNNRVRTALMAAGVYKVAQPAPEADAAAPQA